MHRHKRAAAVLQGAPFHTHLSPNTAVINPNVAAPSSICMHSACAAGRERGSTAGICFVFPSHLIMLIIRHKRTGVFSRHNLANRIAPLCWTGGEFATQGLSSRAADPLTIRARLSNPSWILDPASNQHRDGAGGLQRNVGLSKPTQSHAEKTRINQRCTAILRQGCLTRAASQADTDMCTHVHSMCHRLTERSPFPPTLKQAREPNA